MTANEFIHHYCGELTERQRHMTQHAVDNNCFYGVGRAIGRTAFWPLVSKNGMNFDVIDGAGYNQLPSLDGRIGYTFPMREDAFTPDML